MNRKISFRGYNLKNKQWLYGYYFVNRGKHYIVQDETVSPFAEAEDFEVDAESVGQYAGTIKGVELYEGDHIEYKHTSITDYCETSITTRHRLVFNQKFGQVLLQCIDDRYTSCGDYGYLKFEDEEIKYQYGILKYKEEYKVIGNEYEKNKYASIEDLQKEWLDIMREMELKSALLGIKNKDISTP